jgi:hypothetical protein
MEITQQAAGTKIIKLFQNLVSFEQALGKTSTFIPGCPYFAGYL